MDAIAACLVHVIQKSSLASLLLFACSCLGQTSGPNLVVSYEGERPHALLRYELETGSEQNVLVRFKAEAGQSIGSTPAVVELMSDFEMGVKVVVLSRLGPDSWKVSYEVTSTRVRGSSSGISRSEADSNLARMVGFKWHSTFTSRGRIRDGKVVKSVDFMSNAEARSMMDQLEDSAFVLPKTEVGNDARWSLESRVNHDLGFTILQSIDVRLLDSPNSGILKFACAFNGEVEDTEISSGQMNVTIKRFDFSGADLVEISLRKPMPIKNRLVLEADFLLRIIRGGEDTMFSGRSINSMASTLVE